MARFTLTQVHFLDNPTIFFRSAKILSCEPQIKASRIYCCPLYIVFWEVVGTVEKKRG